MNWLMRLIVDRAKARMQGSHGPRTTSTAHPNMTCRVLTSRVAW